jgi:hypothetical protein
MSQRPLFLEMFGIQSAGSPPLGCPVETFTGSSSLFVGSGSISVAAGYVTLDATIRPNVGFNGHSVARSDAGCQRTL